MRRAVVDRLQQAALSFIGHWGHFRLNEFFIYLLILGARDTSFLIFDEDFRREELQKKIVDFSRFCVLAVVVISSLIVPVAYCTLCRLDTLICSEHSPYPVCFACESPRFSFSSQFSAELAPLPISRSPPPRTLVVPLSQCRLPHPRPLSTPCPKLLPKLLDARSSW